MHATYQNKINHIVFANQIKYDYIITFNVTNTIIIHLCFFLELTISKEVLYVPLQC
jgi:hypothetical protein